METERFEFVIIGAGLAGLGVAHQLSDISDSFIILEEKSEIGGVWRDNIYPGCRCDTPSSVYEFNFIHNWKWDSKFASQSEVLQYAYFIANQRGIQKKIRFNQKLTLAKYLHEQSCWSIETREGLVIQSRFLILATGGFSLPASPEIPDLDKFTGRAFHSSEWPKDETANGKKVLIIGTGSSGVQIATSLAEQASKVCSLVRTSPWIVAKRERETFLGRFLRNNLVGIQKYLLAKKFDFFQNYGANFSKYLFFEKIRRLLYRIKLFLILHGAAITEYLVPHYPEGCKRRVFSDDFFKKIRQKRIELVTSKIVRIENKTVCFSNNTRQDFDLIVFATGFRFLNRRGELTKVKSEGPQILGRSGLNLYKKWRSSRPATFFGLLHNGFPNLFSIVGPNSGLNSGSILTMIESQIIFILKALHHLREHNMNSIEVREYTEDQFFRRTQEVLKRSVWDISKCENSYQNAEGIVTGIWPGTSRGYRERLMNVGWQNFILKADGIE